MFRSLLATTALVGLLAGGAAIAQTTQSGTQGAEPTQPNPTVQGESTTPKAEGGATMEQTGEKPATDAPGTTDEPAGAMTDEQKPDTAAETETTPSTSDAQTSAATTGDVGGFVTEQDDSQILATNYIGQSVVNAEDESVGKINDLVMDENGKVTAAVIGVGGFLGVGEKEVGVPIESIEVRSDQDGEVQLVMQATREELEAAPEFVDLDAKMEAQEAASQPSQPTSPSTAPSTAPAN